MMNYIYCKTILACTVLSSYLVEYTCGFPHSLQQLFTFLLYCIKVIVGCTSFLTLIKYLPDFFALKPCPRYDTVPNGILIPTFADALAYCGPNETPNDIVTDSPPLSP